MKIIPKEKFYTDERGGIYRFLWREFRESADRAGKTEGREEMKERLAQAGNVSVAAVKNHLRPRTARGANFPSDIVIIRAYGRILEGDETAFLEPYILRPLVPANVTTGTRAAG